WRGGVWGSAPARVVSADRLSPPTPNDHGAPGPLPLDAAVPSVAPPAIARAEGRYARLNRRPATGETASSIGAGAGATGGSSSAPAASTGATRPGALALSSPLPAARAR